MILIRTEQGRSVDFPSSWDELRARQIRHIWKMQDRCLRSGASPLEFSIQVLYYLLGIKPHSRHPDRKYSENVYMLCEQCLGFLFSGNGATLGYDSLINPIPRIGLRQGPGNMLRYLTFGEFRHVSAAMEAYTRTHDIADLDECVAILYRIPWLRVNRAGRRTAPPGRAISRIELALSRRTATWRKALAFAWLCHTIRYLQSGRLVIDGEQVDLSLLFSSSEGSSGPEYTWNDLLIQLARDGVLGNADRVDEEPLMSILSIMWSNYKESKRYEKALKANKSK